MDKAYVDFLALYRMTLEGAFFVTRAKITIDYHIIETNFNIDESTGLRGDKTIMLSGYKSKHLYPEPLLLVEYYDNEKDTTLVFLTNNFDISALEVTRLYKNRWMIEVFFYDKHIFMQSGSKDIAYNQEDISVTVHIWAYTELSCFYRWRFITVKGSSCEEAVGRDLYGSAHLFCLIRRISIGRDQCC